MRLKGEFVLREVAGEIIAIPVGKTALDFNGMLCINAVSAEIWKGLQEGKTKAEILENILEEFDVSQEEAAADLDVFLRQLSENSLLEDEAYAQN